MHVSNVLASNRIVICDLINPNTSGNTAENAGKWKTMNEWIKCCDTGNVFEIILPLNLNLISIYIKEITFFRIIWCCPLKRGIWIGPGSIGEEKQSKIGLRIEAKYIESIENWFPSSAGEVLAEVWLVDCLLGGKSIKMWRQRKLISTSNELPRERERGTLRPKVETESSEVESN